jgi:peptide/nickel transport system permease protein
MRARAWLSLGRVIALRFLYGLLSLLFISLVVFVADELAPGDAALIRAGEKASEEQYQRIREQMGLDRPWPERYVDYVTSAAQGDFGRSYFDGARPVSEVLAQNLPMTLRLAGLSIALAAGLALAMGTIAAIYENRAADRAVLTVSTLGVTVPNFVLAPILVYIFALQLDQLPTTWEVNRVAPDFYYLVLPVVVLAARPMAQLTRLTRASMIDTLNMEFIRLATAKGVPPLRLYLKHGLRNAILPVITAIGTSFGYLLTGSFIVETFFAMPGLGSTAIEAIKRQDTPVVQATVFVAGALFITINLLVDVVQPLLDPRIRESQV